MGYRIVESNYYGMPCYKVFLFDEYCCQFVIKEHALKYISEKGGAQ